MIKEDVNIESEAAGISLLEWATDIMFDERGIRLQNRAGSPTFPPPDIVQMIPLDVFPHGI
jgi:hypothetical protein